MSFFSKVVMGAAVVGAAAVAAKVGVAGVALAGAGVAAKSAYDYTMAGNKAQARKEWANKVGAKAEEAKVIVEEAPVVMKNRIRNRLRMAPVTKAE